MAPSAFAMRVLFTQHCIADACCLCLRGLTLEVLFFSWALGREVLIPTTAIKPALLLSMCAQTGQRCTACMQPSTMAS